MHPVRQAAAAVCQMDLESNWEKLDNLCEELGEHVAAAKNGETKRSVTMLCAQSHTLEALFYHLVGMAVKHGSYEPSAFDTYLKPAFRAQSQCRATVETIANLKNPRAVAWVQTNIAENMQVNNSTAGRNPPSKLLGQTDGERVECGAQGKTGGCHPTMETLGAVNRPPNTEG